MMMLVPGVRLVLPDAAYVGCSRISISMGTEEAGGRSVGNGSSVYRRPAFIPRPPWCPLDPENARTLMRGGVSDPRAFVSVVRISEGALARMHALGIGAQLSREKYDGLARSTEAQEAIRDCLLDVSEYLVEPDGLSPLGFSVGEPGLTTVAMDPLQCAGLHVDNWDEAAPVNRKRNRLHLNLGREPRHLLFINILVHELPGEEGANVVPTIGTRDTRVGQTFMSRYPHYPVIRVRIDPGEGYIAPTDEIIHDGDSTGKILPDVNFAILGYWGCSQAAE